MQQDDHNLRMEAKKTRNTLVKQILSIDIFPLKYTKNLRELIFGDLTILNFSPNKFSPFLPKFAKSGKTNSCEN